MFTDTDFAGDLLDRKSTSATFTFHGIHLIKSTVSTQTVIALSSGEAEFAGMVKGASVGLGVRALMKDLGHEKKLRLHTDSSAAKGIAQRKGVGRIRHLHTPLLWIQQKTANKELRIFKVDGNKNVADLGTKELARSRMMEFLKRCGFEFMDGRHPKALGAQLDCLD